MLLASETKIRISPNATKEGLDLYPFQKAGVKYLLDSPAPYLYLADEMGLGKSIQALTYANSIYAEPLLIVCTAGLRLNWLREVNLWYDMAPPHTAAVILSSKDVATLQKRTLIRRGYLPSVLITSYEMLVTNNNLYGYILNRKWKLGIFDEFQECRNITAQRTQRSLTIVDKVCSRALFLSGTPMENSAADLFPPLYLMVNGTDYMHRDDYEALASQDRFENRFTYVYNSKYGRRCKGARNIDHLRRIVHGGKFYIRRKLETVLPDLPPKSYNRLDLNLRINDNTDPEKLERFLKQFEKDETSAAPQGQKSFGYLRRQLGEAKADHPDTIDFIESCIREHGCVMVGFYHKTVRDTLIAALKHHGIVLHDGDTTASRKQRAVDLFQNGDANVFLGQVEAGIGYTITRARDVVYVEYAWLSTQNNQFLGRAHRIGQKNPVTGHYVVAENAFDKALVRMMISKQKAIDKVVEG